MSASRIVTNLFLYLLTTHDGYRIEQVWAAFLIKPAIWCFPLCFVQKHIGSPACNTKDTTQLSQFVIGAWTTRYVSFSYAHTYLSHLKAHSQHWCCTNNTQRVRTVSNCSQFLIFYPTKFSLFCFSRMYRYFTLGCHRFLTLPVSLSSAF